MKKMSVILGALLIVMLLSGCNTHEIQDKLSETPIVESGTLPPEENWWPSCLGIGTTIPIESVEGISELEAEKLCLDVLGRVCEANGFAFGYHCVDAVEFMNKKYYVMDYMHRVQDKNSAHWSHIDYLMVSAGGDKIYGGNDYRDGTYHFDRINWQASDEETS
jgi:hypothetical protein